jgi:signal transduction histidine kinase
MLSLRTRVLVGALFWTIGLVVVSFAGLALVFRYFPSMPFVGRTGAIHTWVFHTGPVLAFALVFLVAGAIQVRRGLSGINQLRTRLGAVHDGREARVDGHYVPEVQPLVDDLNSLLEHREQAVRRALAKAGDLAHGLKTPLAILAHEADRAVAAGHADLASAISQQVERMRRQVEYHLAHARAAASGGKSGARSSIRESADGLVRALLRLHASRGLEFDVKIDPSHTVRCEREDLDEMLGNLLDNACKWARGQVSVTSSEVGGWHVITVDDDGAGLAVEMREKVLKRGVRADEVAPGSGLGLAIVRDLAELYGGAVALSSSPQGGLRAELRLR